MSQVNKPPTLFEWLGLNDLPDYSKARFLGHMIGFFLKLITFAFIALFFLALAAAFVLVSGVITDVPLDPPNGQTATTSLGLGALLVALLGAPFLIWRTIVAQNTLDTARKEAKLKEESLFNDKINAAAKDLAARRQVTRVVVQDEKETILTEWEDDLVTRAAAIDLLEGLANERPDAAPRIARQLSIYVRELSRQYPPKEPPMDATPNLVPSGADATPDKLQSWAQHLAPTRSDMEKAAQTLGRLQNIKEATLSPADIDLRSTNLQGFDLRGLNFTNVRFGLASLQGTRLSRSHLQGADFTEAQMQGTILSGTQLQGARFYAANMQRAQLTQAQARSADFYAAQMQGARLYQINAQGAYLRHAQLQGARLHRAQMQCADLSLASLQAASLRSARFQGAQIDQIEISEDTQLFEVSLNGASFQRLDEATLLLLKDELPNLFTTGFTAGSHRKLPTGIERPAHWPSKMLLLNEFRKEWRAWAATLTPPVTIAPDYRDKDAT
jgi:uncharacterized protein YjbI with pentapeptide repeats